MAILQALVFLSLLTALLPLSYARPQFRALVPNGLRLSCGPIGHINCIAGGPRNRFGLDFLANGFTWNETICQMDSDGDGLTNGWELGDPCCLWRAGSPDSILRSDFLSLPGDEFDTGAAMAPPTVCPTQASVSTPTPSPSQNLNILAPTPSVSLLPAPSLSVVPAVTPSVGTGPLPTPIPLISVSASMSIGVMPTPSVALSAEPALSVMPTMVPPSVSIGTMPTPSVAFSAAPSLSVMPTMVPPSISIGMMPTPSVVLSAAPSLSVMWPFPTSLPSGMQHPIYANFRSVPANFSFPNGAIPSDLEEAAKKFYECFPGDSTILLKDASRIRMKDLKVGDEVLSALPSTYSQVYFFSHQEPTGTFEFVRITTENGREITASKGHYIYANGRLKAAGSITIGDRLFTEDGQAVVTGISLVEATGLYNPHTLFGSIVVDGVLASDITTALKPSLARSLLAPIKFTWRLFRRDISQGYLKDGWPSIAAMLPDGVKEL